MSSSSNQIIQLLRQCESFATGTTAILGLLTTAFTPLPRNPVLSPPLHSFILSTYCVMMILSIIALIADVNLRSTVLDFDASHWNEILRTISILTGSLAVILLLSISTPYIALVFLVVWLLLAIYLIRSLCQSILPTTNNATSNSISAVFDSINVVLGRMKDWATNLLHG